MIYESASLHHTVDLSPHSNHLFICKIKLCSTQFGLQLTDRSVINFLVNLRFYRGRFSSQEAGQTFQSEKSLIILPSAFPTWNESQYQKPKILNNKGGKCVKLKLKQQIKNNRELYPDLRKDNTNASTSRSIKNTNAKPPDQ